MKGNPERDKKSRENEIRKRNTERLGIKKREVHGKTRRWSKRIEGALRRENPSKR